MKKVVLAISILLVEFLAYVIFLPAINIHSLGFWSFFFICCIPFALWYLIKSNIIAFKDQNKKVIFNKPTAFVMGLVIFAFVFLFVINFIGLPLLGGLNSYRNRIEIPEKSDFSEIEEFDSTQVQIIDKDVSISLADRIFGELGAETVSMYQVSGEYSSSVLKGTMYRMTPAEYNGFIKWFSTKKNGTPGFISVNVTTGETMFHKTEGGLKYTPKAFFLHNLTRHLRLQYPTCIFGKTFFECDDSYNPYWVTQVMSYSFVQKAEDVQGVILTNPTTGDSEYYNVEDVPEWVDNVFDSRLVCSQYNSYGKYVNGLFNFSQKGITSTTDDYAYLQKDGHLWMYTGITSVGKDESNVGFIYVDLQSKKVVYIASAGAEEYSARSSAEGALQEKGYMAIFPTMVNISNNPVYFMGLKDNGGLIKAYAFVDYKDYQKVGVGDTVKDALKDFKNKTNIHHEDSLEKTIIVADIQSAVVEGYTIYFIKGTDNNVYSCSIEVSNLLPFVKVGDQLKVFVDDNMIVSIQ